MQFGPRELAESFQPGAVVASTRSPAPETPPTTGALDVGGQAHGMGRSPGSDLSRCWMTPGSCARQVSGGTDMASTRCCLLTLLLAATCPLHAAVVAGKGLPAWTGLADSSPPQLWLTRLILLPDHPVLPKPLQAASRQRERRDAHARPRRTRS